MSARLGGGGGGGGRKDGEVFLSAHRCPEVDVLPRRQPEARVLPPGSASDHTKQPEIVGRGQSESNYLDVSSTPRCDEDGDGSVSDWSEEDLSLHFSPSVIISSDDEESLCAFECVDITMETLVSSQEGEGPKMVPKRQIQLKKKEEENLKEKKLQVRNEPPGSSSEVSPLSPSTRQRPDLLLRQHSMPASTSSGDAESHRVYRGLIAGANQGLRAGGTSKQRLQKSFSLDETKTKMASCLIKSVLSKKMQAEQSHGKTPHNKPTVVPNLPQAAEQQRAREGGGGEAGGGVAKAPLHVVRDMRSLVKNTYSQTFSASQTGKPLSFKVVSQGGSPPPTYQQAVGVKGHSQTKNYAGGGVKHVAASQPRNQRSRPSRPITQQRRGSKPIVDGSRHGDVIRPAAVAPPTKSPSDVCHPPRSGRPQRAGEECLKAGPSLPSSEVVHPPAAPPPSSRHPESTQPVVSTQEQGAILGVPSQQVFHPCLYAPAALPPFAPTVVHHMGKLSYVQGPLNYIQTPLQPNLHLLRKAEENQGGSSGDQPHQRDRSPPPRPAQDQNTAAAPGTPKEPAEEQLASAFQGFQPVKVGNDAVNDASSPPGAPSNVPAPGHMLDPRNLQCFYVDVPPQSQRKMLLDPETGQYVQVFLPVPAAAAAAATAPLGFAGPAPFAPAGMKPAPAILSVMQFQPTIAVSPLYAPPFLPFPMNAPSINFTHAPL